MIIKVILFNGILINMDKLLLEVMMVNWPSGISPAKLKVKGYILSPISTIMNTRFRISAIINSMIAYFQHVMIMVRWSSGILEILNHLSIILKRKMVNFILANFHLWTNMSFVLEDKNRRSKYGMSEICPKLW